MKVALAQIDCIPGDVKANAAKMLDYARRAAAAGCRAVIFPELSDTGYQPELIAACSGNWDSAPFTELAAAAADFRIYFIGGLSERVNGTLYNSVAVIDPRGELIGRYRKTHLFGPSGETEIFAPGNSPETVVVDDMRWGLSICFDLRFPELYSLETGAGAQVLVNCTAWLSKRAEHWQVLTRARAIENQCWFLGVNRVGSDGQMTFCGNSCIISPFGDLVACAASDSEELLTADISAATLNEVRQNLPSLASRRPELYFR